MRRSRFDSMISSIHSGKPVRQRMIKLKQEKESADAGPYEAALTAALEDLAQARQKVETTQGMLQSAEARVAELSQLVKNLLAVLPQHRAGLYTQRIGNLRPPPSTRAGPVYDNVVDLFAKGKRREWSAAEVQAALAQRGQQTDPRAVYNVLNYLVRKGSLRRVGRGQYFIADLGVGIHLDQDIDDAVGEGGGCMEN